MNEKTIHNFLMFASIILIIGVVFEVVILGIAFFGADEVDCNFLWCEFKSSRGTSDITVTTNCYENGVRINCSNMTDTEFFWNNGNGRIPLKN